MSRSKHSSSSRISWPVISRVVMFLLALVGLGYWLYSPSHEALLNAKTLTPKQIRIVATNLLLHDDLKIRDQAATKLASCGEPAVPVLREIGLTHSNARLRLAVLGVLASLNLDAAVDVVSQIMSDPDPEVRLEAVRSASQLSDPRGVDILIKALEDPHASVRSCTAGTLGTLGTLSAIDVSRSVPALKTLLDDPEFQVRRHAATSLRTMTGVDYSARVKPSNQ